jgi:hypothetical protein
VKHLRLFARRATLTMIFGASCLGSSLSVAQEVPGVPVSSVPVAAPAANINITPRRVVFDSNKRTEAVYVFNQGTAPVTVDVALVDNVMLPSGEIVPLAQLEHRSPSDRAVGGRLRSARDFLLATPTRMVLQPGKGRTIRLRASLPSEAGSGAEWRSHLTVTTVPTPDAGVTAETAAGAAGSSELGFRIQSVFGISIPLIMRDGPILATAAISDMKIELLDAPSGPAGELRRVPVLTFALTRAGSNSIFGNLEAKSDATNAKELIGFIRGLAVYPEIDGRRVAMPLTRMPRSGETVTVSFVSDDPQLGNVRTSGTLTVP